MIEILNFTCVGESTVIETDIQVSSDIRFYWWTKKYGKHIGSVLQERGEIHRMQRYKGMEMRNPFSGAKKRQNEQKIWTEKENEVFSVFSATIQIYV